MRAIQVLLVRDDPHCLCAQFFKLFSASSHGHGAGVKAWSLHCALDWANSRGYITYSIMQAWNWFILHECVRGVLASAACGSFCVSINPNFPLFKTSHFLVCLYFSTVFRTSGNYILEDSLQGVVRQQSYFVAELGLCVRRAWLFLARVAWRPLPIVDLNVLRDHRNFALGASLGFMIGIATVR